MPKVPTGQSPQANPSQYAAVDSSRMGLSLIGQRANAEKHDGNPKPVPRARRRGPGRSRNLTPPEALSDFGETAQSLISTSRGERASSLSTHYQGTLGANNLLDLIALLLSTADSADAEQIQGYVSVDATMDQTTNRSAADDDFGFNSEFLPADGVIDTKILLDLSIFHGDQTGTNGASDNPPGALSVTDPHGEVTTSEQYYGRNIPWILPATSAGMREGKMGTGVPPRL
ncbi:hypothetical protein QFC20_007582 [Naganishia adeliensis]|uniref:Uncharacterized protein n=1 Tax=Naganishia adeliensis TaxID=92952 RepID=A0ACC2UY60_9TREE|nr:hypothetical protein QFC20_007582 [Naganishia adeliensis]